MDPARVKAAIAERKREEIEWVIGVCDIRVFDRRPTELYGAQEKSRPFPDFICAAGVITWKFLSKLQPENRNRTASLTNDQRLEMVSAKKPYGARAQVS